MSQSDQDRIAREEAYWTPVRLMVFSFVFMAFCVGVIMGLSHI